MQNPMLSRRQISSLIRTLEPVSNNPMDTFQQSVMPLDEKEFCQVA